MKRRSHHLARAVRECAGIGVVFTMTGAAALISLSVIATGARAASQVLPVAGNACFEPSSAAEESLDDGALVCARLHGLIQAHRSHFQACPQTRRAAEPPQASTQAMRRAPASRRVFRDRAQCPEKAVVPAGSFTMGSVESNDEVPAPRVTIAQASAVDLDETTYTEWNAGRRDGECGRRTLSSTSWPDSPRGDLPTIRSSDEVSTR